MQHTASMSSPIGRLDIHLEDDVVVAIDIQTDADATENKRVNHPVLQQLQAYFAGGQSRVDIPIRLSGTPFQLKVWREMQKIPAGKTVSYADIAKRLGSSPRAVGNACRANPIPVIVPCHRVVAKNGLGGYAGSTSGVQIDIKKWLLTHEGARLV
ncbi:MAG: methylated-DNA--[protein]-cysteine S-methyltransferase [Gammaproteobacteria bacterium]|nr:methylated-DNA--[protein]-cysteine S-methyltransferase [Gammaproteobacteria bacterium]MDH5651380.1 methylated-DNA--[protein]-cysteine S-methyltransferase [Gammaproteobacteria bacterium]